jgi:hypothetical protein
MIGYPYGVLYVGVMFSIAAIFMIARHMLLLPMQGHYPKAPTYVQNTMLFSGAAMAFVGIRAIWAFCSGDPEQVPPDPSMQLIGTVMVAHTGVMLANITRQRYPEATWLRLNAINERLLCYNGMGMKGWFARFNS